MTAPQPDTAATAPTDAEQAVVGALTTFLAEATLTGVVVLPPYLYSKLLRLHLHPAAIRAAATLTLRGPLFRRPQRGPRTGTTDTAAALVAAGEPEMRARYLLAAAKRITRDLRTIIPTPPGQPAPSLTDRVRDALRRERRYWRQHVDAQRNRRQSAQAVDDVTQLSPWWQWRTAGDARVEADCRRFAGRTFTVANPPMLDGRPVFPGAVHPHCRCVAVTTFDPRLFGSAPTVTSQAG